MFKFVKYGKLYPPAAWADLKFLSLARDELAAGMLKHSKNPIHNSLTQIPEEDKVTQKLAKEMFKNILGYMGDKKYDNPNLLASEILKNCLDHPNKDLRSEVFCQIIKQLTANPSSDSVRRGWELMTLCLHTFPPPPDFENYLEVREKAHAHTRWRKQVSSSRLTIRAIGLLTDDDAFFFSLLFLRCTSVQWVILPPSMSISSTTLNTTVRSVVLRPSTSSRRSSRMPATYKHRVPPVHPPRRRHQHQPPRHVRHMAPNQLHRLQLRLHHVEHRHRARVQLHQHRVHRRLQSYRRIMSPSGITLTRPEHRRVQSFKPQSKPIGKPASLMANALDGMAHSPIGSRSVHSSHS